MLFCTSCSLAFCRKFALWHFFKKVPRFKNVIFFRILFLKILINKYYERFIMMLSIA